MTFFCVSEYYLSQEIIILSYLYVLKSQFQCFTYVWCRVSVCVWPRCSTTVEVLGGGRGGGGEGPRGISGKGERSAKEGIEEMHRAACRGAVHRSARSEVCGTRRAGEKVLRCMRCSTTIREGWRWGPTYSVEVELQSAAVARPQLGERTAVRPRKPSLRRVYLKGRAQKYFVGMGGWRAGSHLQRLS